MASVTSGCELHWLHCLLSVMQACRTGKQGRQVGRQAGCSKVPLHEIKDHESWALQVQLSLTFCVVCKLVVMQSVVMHHVVRPSKVRQSVVMQTRVTLTVLMHSVGMQRGVCADLLCQLRGVAGHVAQGPTGRLLHSGVKLLQAGHQTLQSPTVHYSLQEEQQQQMMLATAVLCIIRYAC